MDGDLEATPLVNTAFLAVGAVVASVIGTTGASMLLIRPLLHTNSERRHVVHTVIFFIFLVSSTGMPSTAETASLRAFDSQKCGAARGMRAMPNNRLANGTIQIREGRNAGCSTAWD
jgi:hypothetical protein